MTEERRAIELEIEVPGTPEQVWQAIATGPGISSWYVPHEVEAKPGGAMSASFGEAPEMQVQGRVAEWEPPRRVLFDGGDVEIGLAFEWLVEAKDGGTCIVRLVNSGFGSGGEWDDQFDAMHEGWLLFLSNLRLHLEHFPGQVADAQLPMTVVGLDVDAAWQRLTTRLGISTNPRPGDRVEISPEGVPQIAGTVAEIMTVDMARQERKILLVVEEPARGTAFIAAENHGSMTAVSLWTYLYGQQGIDAGQRMAPIYQQLLEDLGSDESAD